MNKGIFAAVGGVIVLAGAGTLGLLGDTGATDDGGSIGPVVIAEDLRPVVIAGVCPAATKTEAARCEQIQQLPGKCICWTRQKTGTVDGEVTDPATLPAGNRVRLVVCEKTGIVSVRWELDSGDVQVGCVAAARPVVDVTLGNAETDLVTQLRAACAPCPVTGANWGPCPHCLKTPGGCAEACR
jgi:hypothetical protein